MENDRFARLTERQRDCLRLVRDGRSTKEIAGILGTSESAIDKTIKLAMAKIGVNRRTEAARLLAEHEAKSGYQSLAPQSPDLSPPVPDTPDPITTEAGERGREAGYSVAETQGRYRIDTIEARVVQETRWMSGATHSLGWRQVLARVMLIALVAMLLAGAALNLVRSMGLFPESLFPEH